jgi:hypothetical protein
MEAVMQVEITVKVNGKLVKTHLQEVGGTLEQMEETIIALSKRIGADTLQASVDAVSGGRPLFRKRTARCGTAATDREGSWG